MWRWLRKITREKAERPVLPTPAAAERFEALFRPRDADIRRHLCFTRQAAEATAAELGVSIAALYEMLAAWLALGFHDGRLGYEVADDIADAFQTLATGERWDMPPLAWEVYDAFDAGEFHRTGDKSDDPVADHTVPLIAGIVSRLRPA